MTLLPAASCAPSDSFARPDVPSRFSYIDTDPPAGSYTRVTFTVPDNATYRVLIKQAGVVVARFYGRGASSTEHYDSPGGEVEFEIARCEASTWKALVTWLNPPLFTPGKTTQRAGAGQGAAAATFTVEFGPDIVRPAGGEPWALRATAANASHRFNQAYYVLRHNTYEHMSMADALSAGLRAVEIDVSDRGDWEMEADGPFVEHGPVGTGAPPRLGHYFREIAGWLNAHPGEGPVLVFIDMKTSLNWPGDWVGEEVYFLDKKVFDLLGARLYTADDLYRHATGQSYAPGRKSLRQAVADNENAWPTLGRLTGKVIVAYTGGREGGVNQTQGGGIEHIIRQPGRTLPYGFFCPDVEEDPHELEPGQAVDGMDLSTSQFVIGSNIATGKHYQVTANASNRLRQILHLQDVKSFLTGESWPLSNGEFPYNYIAVAHGASAIGRDSGVAETFGGALPLVGVRGSVPGYFALRPLHAPHKCMDAYGAGTGNGTKLVAWDAAGVPNQQFVYTAEGQLRPQHSNTRGVDIEGGSAGEGKAIHLWDCDGGKSERWLLDPAGVFRSFDNREFCLSVSGSDTANGTPFITARFSNGGNQKFRLAPVAPWRQTEF